MPDFNNFVLERWLMSIPIKDQRVLAIRSGGRCAFRSCQKILTAEATLPDKEAILGEMAHIVGEMPSGPRGDSSLTPSERNSYSNLILLCNVHHQLIDDKPHTYTVEKLHAMKKEHEEWVEKALSKASDNRPLLDLSQLKTEVTYSTLLPVERMPRYIFGAVCLLRSEKEVKEQMKPLRLSQSHRLEMAPFILRNGYLYTFQDLTDPGNPFANVVYPTDAVMVSLSDWWDHKDYRNWLITLLNRSLNKLCGRRQLELDKEHHRYYFAPLEKGEARDIDYRPLNQKTANRNVVWEPKRKKTGDGYGYWYHRAVSLKFVSVTEKAWCLSIRPELRVTLDGYKPLPSDKIGARITAKKSHMFNYDLLAEVNFWRSYLSDHKPRIILSFGFNPMQNLVISTQLEEGHVTWPGIPEEHAKEFKNVTYIDDIFSWAEFAEISKDFNDDDEISEWETSDDQNEDN